MYFCFHYRNAIQTINQMQDEKREGLENLLQSRIAQQDSRYLLTTLLMGLSVGILGIGSLCCCCCIFWYIRRRPPIVRTTAQVGFNNRVRTRWPGQRFGSMIPMQSAQISAIEQPQTSPYLIFQEQAMENLRTTSGRPFKLFNSDYQIFFIYLQYEECQSWNSSYIFAGLLNYVLIYINLFGIFTAIEKQKCYRQYRPNAFTVQCIHQHNSLTEGDRSWRILQTIQ